MAERDKIRAFRRPALAGWLALVAALVPGTLAAAAQTTLQVEAFSGLPGFHRGELQRYLVLHMAEVGLGDWRFVAPEICRIICRVSFVPTWTPTSFRTSNALEPVKQMNASVLT